MRIPIVDIGNSKGIRIPQAILRQVSFSGDVDLEIVDGRIVLRRLADASAVPELSALGTMDDEAIQRTLRKIKGTDLITALIGADETTKEAVYRNLSSRVREYVRSAVMRLEHGDARDILIEQSRNALSEAIVSTISEQQDRKSE